MLNLISRKNLKLRYYFLLVIQNYNLFNIKTPPVGANSNTSPLKVDRRAPTPNILSQSKNSDYLKVKIEIGENKVKSKEYKNSY